MSDLKLIWGLMWRFYVSCFFVALVVSNLLFRVVFPERTPDIVFLTPTIMALSNALVFGVYSLVNARGLSYLVKGKSLPINAVAWVWFNVLAISVLLLIAGINFIVIRNFGAEFWVKYKLFGSTSIGFIALFLSAYISLYKSKRVA